MTTVYYTLCEQLPQNEYREAVSLLPESMQQRLRRYRRWQDAHAYLYGRLLLKEGMRRLGFKASLESMQVTEFGKPHFIDGSFAFNISHSEEYVVCVISTDETEHLGIDIEKMKPIVFNDFSCVFSPQEKKEINTYKKFYTCWTRKEALVKADGRGLRIPLDTIDATKLLVQLDNDEYFLYKVNIDKDYMIHIASLNKIESTDIIDCLSVVMTPSQPELAIA